MTDRFCESCGTPIDTGHYCAKCTQADVDRSEANDEARAERNEEHAWRRYERTGDR